MRKTFIPPGKLTEIRVRYESGESLRRLCKELEITHVTLSKILRGVGVPIRSSEAQRGRVEEGIAKLQDETNIIEQKREETKKANRFGIIGE